jgi:phage terminase small subunit
MKHNNLTLKQEAFCQAYIKSGDASKAYREVYSCDKMKNEVIHVKACELLKSGKVSVRIEELKADVAIIAKEKFNITHEEILNHLNILRNSRIDEYVEIKKGKLVFKDFDKLTKEQLMCIESVKQNRFGDIEIKLHGKDWTIDKINKHIGFYEKDNHQKGTMTFDGTFDEEKEKRLKALLEKASKLDV